MQHGAVPFRAAHRTVTGLCARDQLHRTGHGRSVAWDAALHEYYADKRQQRRFASRQRATPIAGWRSESRNNPVVCRKHGPRALLLEHSQKQ